MITNDAVYSTDTMSELDAPPSIDGVEDNAGDEDKVAVPALEEEDEDGEDTGEGRDDQERDRSDGELEADSTVENLYNALREILQDVEIGGCGSAAQEEEEVGIQVEAVEQEALAQGHNEEEAQAEESKEDGEVEVINLVGNYIPLEEDEDEDEKNDFDEHKYDDDEFDLNDIDDDDDEHDDDQIAYEQELDKILGYSSEEDVFADKEIAEQNETEIQELIDNADEEEASDDGADGIIPQAAGAIGGLPDIAPPYEVNRELMAQELYVLILASELKGIRSFLMNYRRWHLQDICNFVMPDSRNAVTLAAEMGQRDILKMFYAAGVDLDCRDGEGQTALHKAVANNHMSVVDFLATQGQLKVVDETDVDEEGKPRLVYCHPDLNVTCCEGRTSLHIASRMGHSDVVQILLAKGANCNQQDQEGSAPLHLAAKDGYTDIVEHLLLNNASVNLQTNEGHSPLFLAAREGHSDIVVLLLISGGDSNLVEEETGWAPLHVACHFSHAVVVEQLIDAAADPFRADPNGMIPVVLAARNHMTETVQQIMERSRTSASLYKIAKVAQIPDMDFIKSCGVDVEKRNVFGSTALHEAAREGHEHATHILLSANADPNAQDKEGNTPLHLACTHNNRAVAIQLVAKDAYVTMPNNIGQTCLQMAVQNGEEEITRCLIASGADVNERLPDGSYYLYIAIERNYPSIVRMLIRNGVDTDILFDHGQKPLHLAAKLGRTEILCVLLDHNSTVNQSETYTLKTPLHLASENGHLATVVELIFAQADVNLEAAFGRKPVHLAAREGHRAIVEVLLDAGTRVSST